ncbi:MAG TPA: CRTAC1 family protein, partial [Deltaproteobacteria bacterium]|nr:CRTAC1 family protein [Deltaproteobacteria bacterium]
GAQLFRGHPRGTFEDISDELPSGLAGGSGGAAADYDGDGDLDVFITRYTVPDLLLRNDAGTFVDVSAAAGLSQRPARSMASSWGDLDGDGDLDLFVGVYGLVDESGADPTHTSFSSAEPSFLYLNDGDGTLTERSDLLPQQVHDGYTFSGGWFDLDHDGWLDLYVVNDFGAAFPNVLLWNRGGELRLDQHAHGLDVAVTGMGLGVGDIDGDGIEDLVLSAWDGNVGLVSGSGGAWFDRTAELGIQNDLARGQKIAWGVDLVDMDNDGDLDAPMAYGDLDTLYSAPDRQPDALYLQSSDGSFVDVAPQWGIHHPTTGRGFVAYDLNDDGFLDLVRRDLDGPAYVSLSRCGAGAWLRVRLHDVAPNTAAVGARIIARDDGQVWTSSIRAGGTNHASAGPPEVHLGLGDRDTIDLLEIYWPQGGTSRLTDVATRRILDITRGDR